MSYKWIVMFFSVCVLMICHVRGNEDLSIAAGLWEKDKITVQAQVNSAMKLPVESIVLDITITNNSSENLVLLDLSKRFGSNIMNFSYELFQLPDKDKVELTERFQKLVKGFTGKTHFIEIKAGEKQSFKVNLLEYFVVDKKSDYSLNVSGTLLLKDQKTMTFVIDGIVFSVE